MSYSPAISPGALYLAAIILSLALPMAALGQKPEKPCGQGNQPPCPVEPAPVPPLALTVVFDPPAPVVMANAAAGTLIARVVVTVSDGSPFTGTVKFADPHRDGGGFCRIDGTRIVVGAAPVPAVRWDCTITAEQP